MLRGAAFQATSHRFGRPTRFSGPTAGAHNREEKSCVPGGPRAGAGSRLRPRPVAAAAVATLVLLQSGMAAVPRNLYTGAAARRGLPAAGAAGRPAAAAVRDDGRRLRREVRPRRALQLPAIPCGRSLSGVGRAGRRRGGEQHGLPPGARGAGGAGRARVRTTVIAGIDHFYSGTRGERIGRLREASVRFGTRFALSALIPQATD